MLELVFYLKCTSGNVQISLSTKDYLLSRSLGFFFFWGSARQVYCVTFKILLRQLFTPNLFIYIYKLYLMISSNSLSYWVEMVFWHGIRALMTRRSGNVGLCKFQVQRAFTWGSVLENNINHILEPHLTA
jgi:hypothetical protein